MPAADALTYRFAAPDEPSEDTLKPVRLCVIDVGTNSFHALIADAYPNGVFETVDKLKEMVKLGEGIVAHRITAEAMERGVEALRRIKQLAEGWGATEFIASATSAVREAKNGGAFIEKVRREVGLSVKVIDGETEAELIYRAVRRAVDLPEKALLVDIGGGSTEFIIADREKVYFLCSLKLGAARMTQEFVTTDPVEKAEFRAMRTFYREQLAPVYEAVRTHGGVHLLVGSSGTMENLAAVFAAEEKMEGSIYEPAFDAQALRKTTKAVMKSRRAERETMKGIDEKRLDQIVAGVVLVDVLLKDLAPKTLRLSPDALREGMVEAFIEKHARRLRRVGIFDSVRRRSVYELGFRFDWAQAHAEHVTHLALALFDVTQPLHERGDEARELLEYAALLHDIGEAIHRKQHHKHSLYLIQHAELRGFEAREQAVIANLARYHRKAPPKARHTAYAALGKDDQHLVRQLSALLRVANGLDRSHLQQVETLTARLTPEALHLTLHTHGDPELDLWGARQHRDLFAQVYERELKVEAKKGPATPQARTKAARTEAPLAS